MPGEPIAPRVPPVVALARRRPGRSDVKRGWRTRIRRWLRARWPTALAGVASLGVFVLWQTSNDQQWVDPLFTSSPLAVLAAGQQLLASPSFRGSVLETAAEFVVGYALSAVVGVAFGMLAGRYARLREFVQPFVAALYATPRIAILPLLVLWIGIGTGSRLVFIFSLAVLPIFINTTDGVRVVDAGLVRVARAFGASELDIFRTVTLPYAVPQIVSGLKVGLIMGMLAVVTAEFFIGSAGLGYLLLLYGASFQTARLMFVVLLTAGIGVVSLVPLTWLESRFESWRPSPGR